MARFSLDKQTYEVPGSRVPGSSGIINIALFCITLSHYDLLGIYRNAKEPVVRETISPKIQNMIDLFDHGKPTFTTKSHQLSIE